MDILFTPNAWEDIEFWISNDIDTLSKIKELIRSIRQDPFRGLGKPEPLKFGLKGYWSRRITGEHRIVYKVSGSKGVDQKCLIIQCGFRYDEWRHYSPNVRPNREYKRTHFALIVGWNWGSNSIFAFWGLSTHSLNRPVNDAHGFVDVGRPYGQGGSYP